MVEDCTEGVLKLCFPPLCPVDRTEGVLKPVSRHVHAEAMTLFSDKEALAEEWHKLLCLLDPLHPEYINTPIAEVGGAGASGGDGGAR